MKKLTKAERFELDKLSKAARLELKRRVDEMMEGKRKVGLEPQFKRAVADWVDGAGWGPFANFIRKKKNWHPFVNCLRKAKLPEEKISDYEEIIQVRADVRLTHLTKVYSLPRSTHL